MQISEIPLKGVTRETPDNVAANGELELAINLVNDGSGVEMGEKPTDIFTLNSGERLLLIHKGTGYWHYITVNGTNLYYVNADPNTGELYHNSAVADPTGNPKAQGWYEYTNSVYVPTNDTTVVSDKTYYELNTTRTSIATISGDITTSQVIGNTIIYNDANGIHYLLWKSTTYKDLGQKPPMINLQFGLESEFLAYPGSGTNPITISGKRYRDQVALPWWEKISDPEFVYVPPTKEQIDYYKQVSSTAVNQDFSQTTFTLENVYASHEDTEAASLETIEQISNAVMANINKFVAKQSEDGKFVFPFYLRYAYELFDGSYIMHSYPVLMIPNSRGPVFALDGKEGLRLHFKVRDDEAYDKTMYIFRGRVYGFSSKLQFWIDGNNNSALNDWSDIVKNVSVFATAPAYDHDQSGKVYGWQYMVNDHSYDREDNDFDYADTFDYDKWKDYFSIGKMNPTLNDSPIEANYTVQSFKDIFPPRMAGETSEDPPFQCWDNPLDSDSQTLLYNLPSYIMSLPKLKEQTQLEKLSTDGVYYRICTLPLEDVNAQSPDYTSYYLPIGDSVLKNLTTQPQLTDDFYSHDVTHSDISLIYNRRLNLAEVERTPHTPLPPFDTWGKEYKTAVSATHATWEAKVFIKSDSSDPDIILECKSGANNGSLFVFDGAFPRYVYYPNPKAYKVLFKHSTNLVAQTTYYYEIKLQEHTALNGAYWISDLRNDATHGVTPSNESIYTSATPTTHNIKYSGEIITSEAENPFNFLPKNVNKIGDGKILNLCAAVAPLSEGQFGQFPLYAFTSEGVWALSINSTGEVAAIQPVTRDVILKDTTPLSLDQSVIFLTTRGVLQLAGRHVKELSKPIHGKAAAHHSTQLEKFIKAKWSETFANHAVYALSTVISSDTIAMPAMLAYDYLNSRIYVTPVRANNRYSWVYNLKSGLWTQSETHVTGMVNSYPECIFTQADKVVRITDDLYNEGLLLTRPLKLTTHGFAKLRELVLRGYNDADHTMTMLSATRNWKNYAIVRASLGNRLNRLGGTPYNAHTVAALIAGDDEAVITHLSATFDIEQSNRLR